MGGCERLRAACSRQQGGRLYPDMADGLLELRGVYPPGDRSAAHGYLHRPEDQGTGVVREPKGKDAEKWEAPRAPGQVAAGAGGGAGVSLLRLLY